VTLSSVGRMFRCGICLGGAILMFAGCAGEEEEFPDQIPAIKSSLGIWYRAVLDRDRALLDSVSTDPELYDELLHVLGEDSLAILTRRIQNPIDSAHVTMTVAAIDRSVPEERARYELQLFMRMEGETCRIVAHRLTHSPP